MLWTLDSLEFAQIELKGCDCEPGAVRGTFKFDGKVFEDSGYLLRKVRRLFFGTTYFIIRSEHICF